MTRRDGRKSTDLAPFPIWTRIPRRNWSEIWKDRPVNALDIILAQLLSLLEKQRQRKDEADTDSCAYGRREGYELG